MGDHYVLVAHGYESSESIPIDGNIALYKHRGMSYVTDRETDNENIELFKKSKNIQTILENVRFGSDFEWSNEKEIPNLVFVMDQTNFLYSRFAVSQYGLKDYFGEKNALIKLTNSGAVRCQVPGNVFTMEDLIKTIKKQSEKYSLLVYTCRTPLLDFVSHYYNQKISNRGEIIDKFGHNNCIKQFLGGFSKEIVRKFMSYLTMDIYEIPDYRGCTERSLKMITSPDSYLPLEEVEVVS